jgi:RHS repeat-associated protein
MSKLRLFPLLALILQPLFAETATIQGGAGGATTNATVTVIIDSDRDGWTDAEEATAGTDPNREDTDGDGLKDSVDSQPLTNQFSAPWLADNPVAAENSLYASYNFTAQGSDYVTIVDVSGIGRNAQARSGALTNSTAQNNTSGISGAGFACNGQYHIALPKRKTSGSPTVKYYDVQSISLWVKFNGNALASAQPIFSYIPEGAQHPSQPAGSTNTLNPHVRRAMFRPKSGGGLEFVTLPWASTIPRERWDISKSAADLEGRWVNIVLTYADGSTAWKLYIDGVAQSRTTSALNSFVVASGNSTVDEFFIGVDVASNYPAFNFATKLGGTVDRLQLYKTTLSAAQVATLAGWDVDGDGVSDAEERGLGTDPTHYSPDVDGDGLTNAEEAAGQAVFDGVTKTFGATKKTDSDTDDDLFYDYWEAKYFSANVNPNDATKPIMDDPETTNVIEGDYDNDGLSNYLEMLNGTDPNEGDTDSDGISDKDEAEYGSDPLNLNDRQLTPADFYGEELPGTIEDIGNLGTVITPQGGDSPVVNVQIGDPSGTHSEQWQIQVGDRTVSAPSYGVVSQVTPLTLDTTDYHTIKISHITTDPNYLSANNGNADYDYWAMVKPDDGSPFLLYDPSSMLNDPDSIPEDTFKDNVDPDVVEGQIAYLVPLDNFSWATSYSGGDAVGPKYRKVALNGRPLADEKPQNEAESDLPDEQTFIDAFNLSLHHDTTYHYTPLGSSDLVLQASASTAETSFTSRSGLKPHERFDLPFGPGWSSNLCSYVEVVETLGDQSNDPVTVNVVDEAGSSQRFATRDFSSFFPWPSTRSDKKTYLNTLSRNGTNFTLQKKFGNTLTFTKCKTWFMYSSDRVSGSTTIKRHTYWRLAEARDRYGVRLQYVYDTSPGVPNDVALIPRRIFSPDRQGQYLDIVRSSDSRRVLSITDSRLNTTTFSYTAASSLPLGYPAFQKLDSVSFDDGTSVGYTYDSDVEEELDGSDPENPRYTYYYHTNLKSVTDKRNNTHVFNYDFDQSKKYWDSSISGTSCPVIDELPADVRGWVEEQLEQRLAEGHGLWKTIHGQPRCVTSVVLPGGAGTSTFVPQGGIRFDKTVSFTTLPSTTVTDADGNVTIYEFNGMQAEVVDVDRTDKSLSKEWMVYYLTSSIHHGGLPNTAGFLGTESYAFDPASGLALWWSSDLSGNETTWGFENDHDPLPPGLPSGSATMTKWADPTSKTDALGRREDYTYSGSYRVMETIDDAFDTTTTFFVDGLGRRTSKNVLQGGTAPLAQERYDYTNQRFKAFQTGKTSVAFSNVSGQAWEKDLQTAYLPDTNGRLWREIIDPQGEKLVTEHAYDLNGNRISTLDARGNRTRFEYDKLNRLTKVTYPSAGTRAGVAVTTKETWYNLNGNKAAEIDEEGHYTLHHYDALNRRIKTIRDMDGMGLPTRNGNGLVTEATKGSATGNDLVTTFEYNNVGTLIRQTDPRGFVTRTFVDAIQRPTHVFAGFSKAESDIGEAQGEGIPNKTAKEVAMRDWYSNQAEASTTKTHTEYLYTDTGLVLPRGGSVKGNPGSSAFNTSGFKPTHVIRHKAVLTANGPLDLNTYTQYDALYRPVRTETQYESGSFAVSTTAYGAISSNKEALQTTATDDRGKVTLTVLDGLQRPLSVTDAFGTALAATSSTVYSSTGLAWKKIDPLTRETETEYDAIGRPVKVWQPDPLTGLVNRATPTDSLLGSPCTQTGYDRNGNVAFTVNPLGFRWDYEYDARNRKTVERQPAVTKTEIVNGTPVHTSGLRPVTATAYDGVGTPIATTNARGHVSRSFHDQAYRVTDVLSNPLSGQPSSDPASLGANDILVHTSYDENGNVLEVIDGNGNTTRNTYDSLNRLVTTATNPVNGQPSANPAAPNSGDITVTNAYDDAGNLVQVKDGENQLTGFLYDGLGRKTRTFWDEDGAVEREEQATFDGVVQLTRRNAKEQFVTFEYDALNRLEDVLYTGSSSDNRHLTYDLVGNLLGVSYPNETTERQTLRGSGQTFDKLNRLTEETSAGATHVHTHDKAGNRRTTTYAGSGRYLTNTYDSLNRLATCNEKASPSAPSGNVTSYAYDLNGNVTRKLLPNGSATNCVFDACNRKLSESTLTSGGALIASFDYSRATSGFPAGYDAAGNVLAILERYPDGLENRNVYNTYDKTNRLAVETTYKKSGSTISYSSLFYRYDNANNRSSKLPGNMGSVPSSGIDFDSYGAPLALPQIYERNVYQTGMLYPFPSNGEVYFYGDGSSEYNSNQVALINRATPQFQQIKFLYDANGNRTEKQVGGATVQTYGYDRDDRLVSLTDSVKGTFAYTYDHRTRRVGRDETNANGTADEVSFAGGLSVQEYTTSNGTPTVEYVRGSDYGGGIGGVLYTIRGGSTRSYNAYNSRGDVVSKTGDSGAITWQSAYEAFGTRTQEQGSTLDRQKANTKDEDPTGLLNEGMRYRDLEFGLFLTRDPAGFVDGTNVYTYVRQNPWSGFDPDGLATTMQDGSLSSSTEIPELKRPQVSSRSLDVILKYEVSSESYYNKYLKSPTYPGGASGVTIGFGYDLGYNTKSQISQDWAPHLSENDVSKLQSVSGKTGSAAKDSLGQADGVEVSFKTARKVFESNTVPRFLNEAQKAFPGMENLDPDSQGALLSLVFNRGSAMKGDSRKEMREIRDLIQKGAYDKVPDQLEAMKRVWKGKGLDGLLARRDEEAKVFREGIANKARDEDYKKYKDEKNFKETVESK